MFVPMVTEKCVLAHGGLASLTMGQARQLAHTRLVSREEPQMSTFAKVNVGDEGRVELHEKLGLTGAAVGAAADCGIEFVCIQVKENSLGGFTADDAVVF